MRNAPLRGFCKASPMKTNTEFADRVFTAEKVNRALVESGKHTFKGGRGSDNTSTGNKNAGINNAMIDPNAQ